MCSPVKLLTVTVGDWGIRMVTSGIWRPVKIRFYDAASINDYHIKQLSLTEHSAELSNELENKQYTSSIDSSRNTD